VVAFVAHMFFDMRWQLALLCGAVLSSTDAAAVFSTLRRVPLQPRLAGTLEAESGMNDAPVIILVMLFSSDEPQQGQGEPHTHSGLADHLTPELSAAVADLLDEGASYFFSIRAVGGAVSDVPSEATAYAGRSAAFSLSGFGASSRFDDAWERLVPHLSGSYLSFETGIGRVWLERAFPPAHLARLRELKRRWDPTGLFRDNFYISPAVAAEGPAA